MCGKHSGVIRNLIEHMNEFSTVTRYNFHIQMLTLLLHRSHDLTENEIKKASTLKAASKNIKHLRINLTKRSKHVQ